MAKVTDPVCKMVIDDKDAAASAESDGKTYFFCSQHCRTLFEGDPAKYASGA